MSPSFSHPAYHKNASSIHAAYICLSKAYCYISGINWRCILDNIALINKIRNNVILFTYSGANMHYISVSTQVS